ncbi:SIMPL domain-containing protein [Marinicauda salina]|nr:SIMPL domain-containing protein [Marinicauda salina]
MIRAALLATALALPLPLAATACAQETASSNGEVRPATLSLSATGEVRAAPDMATVSAGAVSRGASAQEALSANARLMQGVFDALDETGIAERDVQTSQLSVNPVYSRPDEETRERRIVAYEARNTVNVIVRDLDGLGETIDALVNAGANELQGVNFGLEERTEAEDAARLQAIEELHRLRDLYAEAGDFEVERVLSISESSGGGPQPMYARMEVMAMAAAPTPTAVGELTVSVTINASWEISE